MKKQSRLLHWLNSHKKAFRFAFHEIMRTPLASIMTISLIAIAITLPLIFFITLKNLSFFTQQWGAKAPSISLYLKTNITSAQTDQFLKKLSADPRVAKVTFTSSQEALADFKKQTQLGDVISVFKNNPLPAVVTILPALAYQSPTKINFVFQDIKNSPYVNIAQIDMDWIKRLFYLIKIGDKVTHVLALFFAVGVFLIISSVLRTAIVNHSEEIEILKLIGATDGFIRRPLLYYGALYAFLGSMLATCITNFFVWLIHSPVLAFARTYQTQITLRDLSVGDSTRIIFISVMFCVLGSWLILSRYLLHKNS